MDVSYVNGAYSLLSMSKIADWGWDRTSGDFM